MKNEKILKDATKLILGTIILSSLFNSRTSAARKIADVPLLQDREYLHPDIFEISFSNCTTLGPVVKKFDFKVLIAADISDLSIDCLP